MTIAAPLIAAAVVKTDGRDVQWIFTMSTVSSTRTCLHHEFTGTLVIEAKDPAEGARTSSLFGQHPQDFAVRTGPTILSVEIGCADCGCIVDSGVRVIPCNTPDCCCRHLPIRESEETEGC